MSDPPGPRDFTLILRAIERAVATTATPSVSQIAAETPDPFHILIATIISLRTRDEVTIAASERLFARAGAPAALSALPLEEIEGLIYPAGFYRTKAKNIRTIARSIAEDGGRVPADRDRLLRMPGVGIKTANLTLGLGYGLPFICVDTHVHRITNRLGWVSTTSPERTETALMGLLPRRHWIELNGLLVSFGQQICTPLSPRCSLCPVRESCPRVGVTRSR